MNKLYPHSMTVRLDQQTEELVAAASADNGMSKAACIRSAIERCFGTVSKRKPEHKTNRKSAANTAGTAK
jgi:hypothetical protein